MEPFPYKTYHIHCVSQNVNHTQWFPKAYNKWSTGTEEKSHTVFGGRGETYTTELVANAKATVLAKAWIDAQAPSTTT